MPGWTGAEGGGAVGVVRGPPFSSVTRARDLVLHPGTVHHYIKCCGTSRRQVSSCYAIAARDNCSHSRISLCLFLKQRNRKISSVLCPVRRQSLTDSYTALTSETPSIKV